MTKQIKLIVENIYKSQDKRYVSDTLDAIVDSLTDFKQTVSNIGLHRDENTFYVKFKLKVNKMGDLVWILCKEFLSCIKQTEPKLDIQIDEVEEDGNGTTYKFYSYRASTGS